MNNKVTCFLPCRKGSERVPRKNIKPFAGFEFGLIQIKLAQLIESTMIDSIVLSTNDDEILSYARSLQEPRIHIHKRMERLSTSTTSTDQLVSHALSLIGDGDILWTHVTSPFITSKHYDQIISCYKEKSHHGFDSLMTTTALKSFLWKDGAPINYKREIEKWPRTQTLDPIHEVNSGAFIAASEIYRRLDDRIGVRPYLFHLDKITSYDIDWPEDFVIAECIVEKGLVTF